MNFGFVIDNRRCIGCHACTVACKSEHDVPVGVNRTWVKYIEKGTFPNTRRIFSVMRCNHCENAPCVEICPTQALFTRPDGIVDFDNRRCIACKSCMQACPYDALYIDPETHTAAKCNYCAHRVEIGLEPACVNVCPTQAIISGDLDDPQSKIANLVAQQPVTVRKPEKGTRPNLFYIEGDEASLTPGEAGQENAYHWSTQTRGVGHHASRNDLRTNPFADILGEASAALDSIKERLKEDTSATTVRAPKARRVYDAPSKGVLWGWEVAGYILTKAVAAGAVIFPFLSHLLDWDHLSESTMTASVLMGLVFLGLTGALLVKDLDQPKRFLYVLLRPHWTSWLVKGAYIITGFGGLLTLQLVLGLTGYSNLGSLSSGLDGLLVIFAVLTSVYTAFLFAQAKGRDFWQSPLLVLHMIIHAVIGGPGVWLILSLAFDSMSAISGTMATVLAWGLVAQLVVLVAELATPHPTEDAHRVVEMITKGPFKTIFWGSGVVLGTLLPLVLLLLSTSPFALAGASLLSLIGLWYLIRLWVQVPQLLSLS